LNTNQRIEVIDLLRGLSCLGVLLYHVRIDLWIGWWRITSYPQEYSSFAKAMAWLSIPTPFLGYAILLFFLISGFCIHFPNASLNSRPCWKNYLKGRFWRIYPTYLAAILFTSVISFYCHIKWGDNTWNIERIFRVITVSQNYPPINGQFLSNPSLWTIPLEIEFYALYPLAFIFLVKFGAFKVTLFSFCTSGLAIYLTKQGAHWISFTAIFLWPSWLLGAWIASLHRENKLSDLKLFYVYIPLIFSLVLALTSRLQNWDSWIQYTCWTGFYFFLFVAVLRAESLFKVNEKLILRSLAWMGRISFSLYLVHFPLFKLFGYLHRENFGEKPANFLVSLVYIIPVIFIAWLFFKYIENPIHKWSKNRKVSP
jgi:peptidoglycan/LPS O-acetylase OafA/YrhL